MTTTARPAARISTRGSHSLGPNQVKLLARVDLTPTIYVQLLKYRRVGGRRSLGP